MPVVLARTVEVALWVIEANRECPLSDGVADGEWQDTTFGDELWGLFPAVAADLRATIAQGILQVDVPAQPPARLPHVVSEAAPFPRGSRITVAVPIREGDATAWLSQAEIQRLLSVGWTNAGGPSDEFLRALIEQTVVAASRPASPSAQGPGIGEGEAGWKGAFEQAHADLVRTGLQLGQPSTLVQWEGPGVVQYFEQQNEWAVRLGAVRSS